MGALNVLYLNAGADSGTVTYLLLRFGAVELLKHGVVDVLSETPLYSTQVRLVAVCR